MRLASLIPFIAVGAFAVETPYDLIRPVYPMEWCTAAVEDGGTVYDFANFTVNEKDTLVGTPKSGAKPADFKANAYIADTLNQAFIDALNLKVSNIRVNQAGYLPDDPEKLFYYVSDKCESATYSVVDLEGEEVAAGGKFSAFGKIDQTVRVVKAYVNSLDKRYTVEKTAPEAKVCAGKLAELAALPTDKRLRIKVGKEYSSTFIVSDKVYSMVRDANLKFFGVQRSGDSESWFHGPSHVHDSIPGGWYDAGDFLKMAPTMGYTFLVLSVLSAVHPERDEDHYAFNHNEIVKTDGIPDMLREARHGAEFYLRSYEYAKGEIKDMIVNIGDETDHNYWTRADSMESMNPVPPRPVMHGIGPGMSAQVAAGLALLSVRYATYDKAFADSCLKVAEKLYAYAKEHFGDPEVCDETLYACGVQKPYDVLAMAAIALHYATYEKSKKMDYLNDAAEDKTINDNINAKYSFEYFPAGWLGADRGFTSGGWTSDYDNRFAITLYAFYKLLLADKETAAKYGIKDSVRIDYTKRLVNSLVRSVSDDLGNGDDEHVDLPGSHYEFRYDKPWFVTNHFDWHPNRYETGTILNLLIYAEVAKSAEIRQLAINKMNYILGANQWDICFMTGVGDKNEAHVHNRTANPEGWNGMTVDEYLNYKDFLASYSYRPPVGALMGGSMTDSLISDWVIFTATETYIDANASFLVANVLLSPEKSAADTSKKDTTKADSTKEAIVEIAKIGEARLAVVNNGVTLDVNYTLPTEQNVKISLVSVKGKVQKLYAPGRESAGSHALQWNVESIPAGAYIVNYSAGSFRKHKLVTITR
ncbi:N-terminal ig-like domain of cellulase [Fibrobacter sp. UWOV1]|uniref:glycoside hydrolase family 9 protein n=1 Tax=Fibrobacter sp. UWOV1 TaxID=1896215 RepID=UPI0009120D19|nr:glycoside hydrolase family 9 protein [Fibrobacter sp. UWOV1]SHK57172.1 N-terminal ig-like domain of cellulase [Fibrobacter sp. UWOV1]